MCQLTDPPSRKCEKAWKIQREGRQLITTESASHSDRLPSLAFPRSLSPGPQTVRGMKRVPGTMGLQAGSRQRSQMTGRSVPLSCPPEDALFPFCRPLPPTSFLAEANGASPLLPAGRKCLKSETCSDVAAFSQAEETVEVPEAAATSASSAEALTIPKPIAAEGPADAVLVFLPGLKEIQQLQVCLWAPARSPCHVQPMRSLPPKCVSGSAELQLSVPLLPLVSPLTTPYPFNVPPILRFLSLHPPRLFHLLVSSLFFL